MNVSNAFSSYLVLFSTVFNTDIIVMQQQYILLLFGVTSQSLLDFLKKYLYKFLKESLEDYLKHWKNF